MNALADRNLLFGLVALQNGIIDQSALVVAFSAWTRDKVRSLAEILLDQGAIDEEDRAALLLMAARHLGRHGGDAGKSLGAVTIAKSLRQSLAGLADPDVNVTLSHVSASKPTATEGDIEATGTYGTQAGDGRRFQILRPHAKGGLGEVFVALDEELHREVALKQILEHHADDPTSRTRFVLEAEITGGLEHPGIVPVYGLGSDGDGRPYYAMRLIRGDSLKEAIAAFHSDESLEKDLGKKSLALRKLLRRFVDVCNAIDYAHGRGVIHRDLKPANIIVGKHGETLVVDWGLAKVMGKSEPGLSDERVLMPSSSSSSAETLPGSALGTPAYMSPEQSLGDLEKLGPRSDVYSLGATLYCLLTGRAPFEGTDLGTVLRNVQKGSFPPPRQVDPTIDKALEAVCLMAMATRREDRYPSSRTLADDLERWAADEPVSACPDPWSIRLARGIRRHKTAAAASAALLMTAVVGLTVGNLLLGAANRRTDEQRRLAIAREREATGLRDLATANFTKAEENYRLARNAVDRYLGVVMNQRLLNEPFMAPLRRELVGSAREFFQEFVDRRAGDPGAITDLARTHSNLARILVLVEGPKSAIPAFERTRAELESLPLKRPDSLGDRQLLLDTLNQLGRYYSDVGRRDDAAASYDRAVELGTRLVGERGESYRTRVLLATTLGDRGDFLAHLGRRDEAQADLKRAVNLAGKLVDERPDDVSALNVLARVQETMGLAAFAREDFRESISWREQSVATAEALLARDPKSVYELSRLAVSLANLGTGYLKVREFERAEATMRRAIDILRALNRDHPTVTDYEDRLAAVLANVSMSLAQLKRAKDAAEANLEAIAVQERLARKHPEVIRYQLVLGSAYGNEGNTWLGRKEFVRALPWFEKSVATMDAILARQPNDVFARQVLRNSAWGQADSLVALGRLADSLPVWDRGIAAAAGNAKLEMRLGRAATLARIGSIDRALAEAETIQTEIGKGGTYLYAVAAKVPALAISTLIEGRATQPGTPSADALGALAVAWLRRAEVAGFFRGNLHRVVEYRDLPDLAVLRPRADFQILMRDLAFPNDPFAR